MLFVVLVVMLVVVLVVAGCFDCCQIHQAEAHTVQLPTTVMAACRVTSQLRPVALSKKCQVQAHMALTRAGSIAADIVRQAR